VEELPTKRGAKPTFIEWLILAWVSGKYSSFHHLTVL